MSPIPDRWIPYTTCGKVIEGTRIICFKVPLRRTVQTENKEIKEIWDIPALLKKIPQLGGVVDLTNTARYYDPRELEAAGVLHKKILIPGRIIPPENKVKEFMDAVDEFLGKDCGFLIGVHCTHGLNRTGYMVCRYMRDRLGINAKEAIKRFENARGYKIERENYLADLVGKKPPPPDIGEETTVRPIYSSNDVRNDMKYKSPLNDYEDIDNDNHRRYDSNTRRLKSSRSWRERDRDKPLGKSRRESSTRNVYRTKWRKAEESSSKYSQRNERQSTSESTSWRNDETKRRSRKRERDTESYDYLY